MSNQIMLNECPEILKNAVTAELARYSEHPGLAEIISCTMIKSLNEANVTYKTYLSNLNSFTILTYIETPPDCYKFGIMKDIVTIGEIKEILRTAPQWFL